MVKRIKITHVHNNCKRDDEHLPPDQGNVPWNKIMPALSDIGYDGSLTLETHCRHDDVELLASFMRHNYEGLKFLERLSIKGITK